MRSNTKYVVFDGHNGEEIITFPKIIQHSDMARDVKRSSFGGMSPISGGFIVDGQCVGESVSLRMKSRGDKDTALIIEMLNLDVDELESVTKSIENMPIVNKFQVSKNKAKRDRKKRK